MTSTAPAGSVPRGQRFSRSFISTKNYTNPAVQVSLTAEFVSPLGETKKIYGFWNGGSAWEIRFRPDVAGLWKYATHCSDAANPDLNGQRGEFLCTAPAKRTAFEQHGALQISRDGRHFEYADRTVFPLILDVGEDNSWNADSATWSDHIQRLTAEKFTATLLQLPTGSRTTRTGLFRQTPNLSFDFQQLNALDQKLDQLNQAGLVAVIAPLPELAVPEADLLGEEETVACWRQVLGRWEANQILWVFAVESQGLGAKVHRWKKIGREIFGGIEHAPVIFFPGETAWLLEEFRPESWVKAFGFQTAGPVHEDTLRWWLMGPLASEWRKSPARPLLNLRPGNDIRSSWWSLFLSAPCGTSFQPAAAGAAQIAYAFLSRENVRQLVPMPRLLAKQPGYEDPNRFIAVAASESRDSVAAYLPNGGSVELVRRLLPASLGASWLNLQTGGNAPAKVELRGDTARFVAPGEGGWLLVIRADGH